MKIILDECVDRRLIRLLPEFDIITVPKAGLAGYKNGQLLNAISGKYDVFITVDSNISSQQKLEKYNITFIVCAVKSNSINSLEKIVPKLKIALTNIKTEKFILIQE